MELEIIRVREDNGGRIRVDNKEEEILYSFKIDNGRFVGIDKIIF